MAGKTIVVALAQMEVVAGQPARNFEKIEQMVRQAKVQGADLIVFPELAVGGRFLADKWADDAFVETLESYNERICGLSEGIGIVFGNVWRGRFPKSPCVGRYDAALFAQDGAWVECRDDGVAGISVKQGYSDACMPDGGRYFDDGAEFGCASSPFRFRLGDGECLIGIEVDEDGSDAAAVVERYRGSGCDLVVQISATPWAWNAGECESHGGECVPMVRVNAVGMQNTGKNVLAFDGGSSIYASDGEVVAACRDDFREELAVVEVSLPDGGISGVRAGCGAPRYADRYEKALDALVVTLRRFDSQVFPFAPKWIIGLSGGIDSSVTAALLSLALEDRSRIVGYNLATRYNSDATKANAYDLAQALGIRLVNGSIEDVVAATGNVLAQYGYPADAVGGLVQENIQARLRGHLLSTFAAIEGGVVMNNGNKVEAALGYATLYGDAIGALCPIGDVTKAQLFEIARRVNRRLGCEAVPARLMPEETEDGYRWEMMPSAELSEGQRDPMKWFYHDWLVTRILDSPGFAVEDVMASYLDGRLLSGEMGKWVRFYGMDDPAAFIEDLEWVTGQMTKSVFKRVQTPPVITLTWGPVSFDRRESQAAFEPSARYLELRERILSSAHD